MSAAGCPLLSGVRAHACPSTCLSEPSRGKSGKMGGVHAEGILLVGAWE